MAGDRIELSTPGFSDKYSTRPLTLLKLFIYRIVLHILLIAIFWLFHKNRLRTATISHQQARFVSIASDVPRFASRILTHDIGGLRIELLKRGVGLKKLLIRLRGLRLTGRSVIALQF